MPSDMPLPVDADTIRTTYDSVLRGVRLPTGEELDTLIGQLLGHVRLLAPEVQELTARMRGETRRTAVHVLVRTCQLLEETEDTKSLRVTRGCDAYDLAVMARALLTLHQHPGPLGPPVGADEIAEEIRRHRCGACGEPIADGEPFERRTIDSDAAGGVHGYDTPSRASTGRASSSGDEARPLTADGVVTWMTCGHHLQGPTSPSRQGTEPTTVLAWACTAGSNTAPKTLSTRAADTAMLRGLLRRALIRTP
ncbi:DUF6415 family natural product biosynthesis protein [Streptomyces sp. NPDC050619]|uniref:DUF6415 family natural product biosynthesis protein n=1 Tax=Streptomyces sp. NPDC050619 TaxID=3157214 RepID=UPI003439D380